MADLDAKQHAHQLLDQLDASQLAGVLHLLEVMIPPDKDDELTDEDRREVAASREWFKNNPGGISLEEVLADVGLTIEDVKSAED